MGDAARLVDGVEGSSQDEASSSPSSHGAGLPLLVHPHTGQDTVVVARYKFCLWNELLRTNKEPFNDTELVLERFT